jgi:hypothetical protein
MNLNKLTYKTIFQFFLVIILALSCSVFAEDEFPNPDIEKFAFLIGNSKHDDYTLDLTSPAKDARQMNAKLRSLGFNTTVIFDTTKDEFQVQFNQFFSKLRAAEREGKKIVVVFFYAGHGIQYDKVNYLVTRDTTLGQQSLVSDADIGAEIKEQLISLKRVTKKLGTVKSHVNLVILDACRNNPFGSDQLDVGGWADVIQKGFYVAFGTKPGQVAKETVENGLFTEAILKHIDTKGLLLPQLFNKVAKDVRKKSGGMQLPQQSEQEAADFYFIPAKITDYLWQLITSILVVTGGSFWFVYYHRKQKVSWVTGIDLTKHIVDDSPVIKEFVSRSRFQKNIRGYVKDLKRKKVVCLIYDKPLTIGRDPTCNVHLPDEDKYVSRMHCDIGWDEYKQSFWLQEPADRPSANGTYAGKLATDKNTDGQLAVGEKYYLSPGEVFYLADPNDKGWPITIIKHKVN